MNHIERLEDLRDQLRTALLYGSQEDIDEARAELDDELDAWNEHQHHQENQHAGTSARLPQPRTH